MRKENILIALLLLSVIFIAGCTANQTGMIKPENQSMNKTGNMVSKESSYAGTILAGSSSPLLAFNKEDYDKAINTNKTVILYFYANWCPICREEFPQMKEAFGELKTDKVVGFRVNFNDDQTYDNERNLARQFGVPYQHTKVFLQNKQSILKSTESWNKQRYLDEINKVI